MNINICKNNENKKENIEKLEEFDKFLDLAFFMNKLQEIELIKFLLLDENTIYLFNFIKGKLKLFNNKQECYDFKDVYIKKKKLQKIYNNIYDFCTYI